MNLPTGQAGPPVVSAIIPAYNAEDFIAETLDSVFAQTYRPLEIIVVDDGSTDRTAEVVKNYLQRNDNETNLRYIYQQNSGPSGARNSGIKSSTGKYVAFLDADDLWPEDKLSKQAGLMELYPDVVLTFGDMRRFSKSKGIAESMFIRQKCTKEFFGDSFYVKDAYNKLLTRNFIPTGTVIIRKDFFQYSDLFDEYLRCVEDWDLWLRIAMHGTIAYSTDVWELKRDHENNVSNNIEVMKLSMLEVLKKHEKNFHSYIRKNNLNFKSHFCDGYYGLGLHYLEKGQKRNAREAFFKSLHYEINIKSIFYLLITFLYQNKKSYL